MRKFLLPFISASVAWGVVVASAARAQEGGEHGGGEHGGGDVIDVIGHRPSPPTHGDPTGRPSRPGTGRPVPPPPPPPPPPPLPPPTEDQRERAIIEQAYLEYVGKTNTLPVAVAIWELKTILEYGSGVAQLDAKAKLEGAVLGLYSTPGQSYDDAKKRFSIDIRTTEPISVQGINLPLKVTTVMVRRNGDGTTVRYFITPKKFFNEDLLTLWYETAAKRQAALQALLDGKELPDNSDNPDYGLFTAEE